MITAHHKFRANGLTLTDDKAKQQLMELLPGVVVPLCCEDSTDLRRLFGWKNSYDIEIARVILGSHKEINSSDNLKWRHLPELARPIFRIGIGQIFGSVANLPNPQTLAGRFGVPQALSQLAKELLGQVCPECGSRDAIGGVEQYIHKVSPISGRLIAVLPWSFRWIDFGETLSLGGLLEIYGAARVIYNHQLLGAEQLDPFLARDVQSFEEGQLAVVIDSASLPLSKETSFSFMQSISSMLSQGNSLELYQVQSSGELQKITALYSERVCLNCGHSSIALNNDLRIGIRRVEDLLNETVGQLSVLVSMECSQHGRSILEVLSLLEDCGFGSYRLNTALDTFSPGELARVAIAEFFNSPIEQAILWLDYCVELLSDDERQELISKLLARCAQHEISVLISTSKDLNDLTKQCASLRSLSSLPNNIPIDFLAAVGMVQICPNRLNIVSGRSGVGKSRLLNEIAERVSSPYWSKTQYLASPLSALSPMTSVAGAFGFSSKIAKAFLAQRMVKLAGFGKDDFHIDRSKYRCVSCCGSGMIVESSFGAFLDSGLPCPDCDGLGWSAELLQVQLHGLGIEQLRDLSLNRITEVFPLDRTLPQLVQLAESLDIGTLPLGLPLSCLSYRELMLLHLVQLVWERQSLKNRDRRLLLIDDHLSGLSKRYFPAVSAALDRLLVAGDTLIMVAPQAFECWGHSVIELGVASSNGNEPRRFVVKSSQVTVGE